MWDWDRMSNDDFMGRATLSLAELLPGQTVSDWVRLKPLLADGTTDDRYVMVEHTYMLSYDEYYLPIGQNGYSVLN